MPPKYYITFVNGNTEIITLNTIFNHFKTQTNKFNTMTPNIKTYINKDDHSIKVCLNTNLDINDIDKKINQIESNIYLNRLKEQYKKYKELKSWSEESRYELQVYSNIRCFCLDTQLLDFNSIELMEFEVNQSF